MESVRIQVAGWALASITSIGAGIVASAQMLLDPENAWVPLGVLCALLVIAVGTTIKVVRLLDGIRHDIDHAQRERKKLAKAMGFDLNGEA